MPEIIPGVSIISGLTRVIIAVSLAAAADIAVNKLATTKDADAATYNAALVEGAFNAASGNEGSNVEFFFEALSKVEGDGAAVPASVTFRLKALITDTSGNTKEITQEVTLASKDDGSAAANDVDLTGELQGFKLAKGQTTKAILNKYKVGDKAIYQAGKNDAAGDLQVQVAAPNPAAPGDLHRYNVKFDNIKGKNIAFQHYSLDAATNEVTTGEVRISFANKKPDPAPTRRPTPRCLQQ